MPLTSRSCPCAECLTVQSKQPSLKQGKTRTYFLVTSVMVLVMAPQESCLSNVCGPIMDHQYLLKPQGQLLTCTPKTAWSWSGRTSRQGSGLDNCQTESSWGHGSMSKPLYDPSTSFEYSTIIFGRAVSRAVRVNRDVCIAMMAA